MIIDSQNKFYSYETTFTLDSDSSLEDLWSYFIFRLNLEHSEYAYDRFARLYNILSDYKTSILSGQSISLNLKESPKAYYISIKTKNKEFLEEFISRLIKLDYEYMYNNGLLEYSITKKGEQKSLKEAQKTTYDHNFISEHHLQDMSDTLEKMQEKNYDKIDTPISLSEIQEYRSTFSYYSSHIWHYPELNFVNSIVAELSVILTIYPNKCLKVGDDLRILLKSFLNNLAYWQDKLFNAKSEKIDFMNTSLKADLSQIKVCLNLYDAIEEQKSVSLDDIFDF